MHNNAFLKPLMHTLTFTSDKQSGPVLSRLKIDCTIDFDCKSNNGVAIDLQSKSILQSTLCLDKTGP